MDTTERAHSSTGHPPENPGYELSDVQPRPMVKTAMVVAGLILFTILAMTALFKLFDYYQPLADHPRHPLADSRYVSTAPKLQPDPPAQKKQLREVEDNVLKTYDWVDREKGLVRIPIDRAIAIVAQQKKLPASPSGGAPKP